MSDASLALGTLATSAHGIHMGCRPVDHVGKGMPPAMASWTAAPYGLLLAAPGTASIFLPIVQFVSE